LPVPLNKGEHMEKWAADSPNASSANKKIQRTQKKCAADLVVMSTLNSSNKNNL